MRLRESGNDEALRTMRKLRLVTEEIAEGKRMIRKALSAAHQVEASQTMVAPPTGSTPAAAAAPARPGAGKGVPRTIVQTVAPLIAHHSELQKVLAGTQLQLTQVRALAALRPVAHVREKSTQPLPEARTIACAHSVARRARWDSLLEWPSSPHPSPPIAASRATLGPLRLSCVSSVARTGRAAPAARRGGRSS